MTHLGTQHKIDHREKYHGKAQGYSNDEHSNAFVFSDDIMDWIHASPSKKVKRLKEKENG